MSTSSTKNTSPPLHEPTANDVVRRPGKEVKLAINHPKKPAGRKKFNETRHPVFRGVRRRGSCKWVSELRQPHKKSKIWLGTYITLEMAARAHDVAAIALRGPTACLNYEDSMWVLPVPATAEPKDIQKAAHAEAEAYRPRVGEAEEEIAPHVEVTNDFSFLDNINEGAIPMSPFMDEGNVFSMYGLLDDMADGLMIPRPQYTTENDYY